MAERYGDELADGAARGRRGRRLRRAGDASDASRGQRRPCPAFDLLNLPRPRASAPWAYVKIAEGCDRTCGFCAIPRFRGPQRSRTSESILDEVDAARCPGDRARRPGPRLVRQGRPPSWAPARSCRSSRRSPTAVAAGPAALPLPVRPHRRADRRDRARPACRTSTCRCSTSRKPLLRRMRRWGDGDRFLRRIDDIRAPRARRRVPHRTSSSATRARPRPTTTSCCAFVEAAQLDWCGFFAYSRGGRHLRRRPRRRRSTAGSMAERLAELRELQDGITARRSGRR